MTSLSDKTFVDTYLDLTGYEVTSCMFDGCILEIGDEPPTMFIDCTFIDCQLQGSGWPLDIHGKP